jgi:DnaK suppressor protein
MANIEDTEQVELDLDAINGRLLEEKARLMRDLQIKEDQVAEDGDELDSERGGVGNHMADDANQTSEQETMLTLESNIRRQLDQVNAALARIQNGTYGICSNCGKPIATARIHTLYSVPAEAGPRAAVSFDFSIRLQVHKNSSHACSGRFGRRAGSCYEGLGGVGHGEP